jgi:SWI/SNF-related matrix-associated actin-dependent regulator 1 of chromatin subfamily A
LGKTIQVIGLINADPSIQRILIICPATLRRNWERELRKWLVNPLTIWHASPSGNWHAEAFNITIINYDILTKRSDVLRGTEWDLVVCDEAHYLKNPEAKRTVAVVGKEKKGVYEVEPIRAKRRIMLTGTPIPNRPIEGWPIFRYLDPAEFNNFWGYAKRYCGAVQGHYGWDLSGSSNLGELQRKLRGSIMIRRLKADVLTELPAKRRSVIEISANGASSIVAAESQAWDAYESRVQALRVAAELSKAESEESYAAAVAALKEAASIAFSEMSQIRHDTAVAKIPYIIEHLRNAIADGSKVVCFAHHHDVIEALQNEFGTEAVSLYGETKMDARQYAVDRFQSDAGVKVFIGGILAAGVGITLTAASHVVFAELDWVPGNVTQAEDRCHRIGQRDMVLCEHLVFEGSIDCRMAHVLVEKQSVIADALDNTDTVIVPVVTPSRDQAATETTTREKIAEEAATMTASRREAIHRALGMLADMDYDMARDRNGYGFSKLDCEIGHSLAQCARLSPKQAALGARLVNKYRRQLPEALVVASKSVVS